MIDDFSQEIIRMLPTYEIAYQFVLEELEAASKVNEMAIGFANFSGISPEEFKGQLNKGMLMPNTIAKGDGVSKDHQEATAWYQKAAQQGHDHAQTILAEAYSKGVGLPKDYKQAYAWSSVAAESGNDKAKNLRELVAQKLSFNASSEGQALAVEYIDKYRH